MVPRQNGHGIPSKCVYAKLLADTQANAQGEVIKIDQQIGLCPDVRLTQVRLPEGSAAYQQAVERKAAIIAISQSAGTIISQCFACNEVGVPYTEENGTPKFARCPRRATVETLFTRWEHLNAIQPSDFM